MGKTKKIKTPKHPIAPKMNLGDQLEDDKVVKSKNRNKTRQRTDEEDNYTAPDISQKVIQNAFKQYLEMEEEHGQQTPGTSRKEKRTNLGDDSSDDGESEVDEDIESHYNIDENDERAFDMFKSKTPKSILLNKIAEKTTEIEAQFSDAGTLRTEQFPVQIQELYKEVGEVLRKYRSGKLPKSFKAIPKCRDWHNLLMLTDPTSWSAAAMYQATRIFASNLEKQMAQSFYNSILLPRIRDDLAEYKRLNFHLYQALRKSLFKPSAFMKGILLPLLEAGDCTLREAIIIGSVVAKNSIPILHSAVTILKIAEMDYTGANSIFLRIFLDKKYALPYRVVDGVVFHFLRFETDRRDLPVLWHQALLTFVQRYKSDISSEQKEGLLRLLQVKKHEPITGEIRRELHAAKCRDFETKEPMDMND